MSDQERIQRSHQWFELATADLKAARAVYEQGIYNIACFLSQQATEKACKGLLTVSSGQYDRVHTIGAMLSRMPPDQQINDLDPERLDKFYIATRYPESHPPETRITKAFGKKDAEDAIDTADGMLMLMLEWAKSCVVQQDNIRHTQHDSMKPDAQTVEVFKMAYRQALDNGTKIKMNTENAQRDLDLREAIRQVQAERQSAQPQKITHVSKQKGPKRT